MKPTLLAVAIAQCLMAGSVGAATITVNSLLDDGDGDNCTLREALGNANGSPTSIDCVAGDVGADTIVFDLAPDLPGVITLGSSPLTISSEVSIQGPGSDQLTVAATVERVFYISDGNAALVPVSIDGLTLANGANPGTGFRNGTGGGIFSEENLTLSNCTLTGNSTPERGGAVINYRGELRINNCTVTNNQAGYGGGVGTYNGQLEVSATTISANTADAGGGIGLFIGTLDMTNSTVSGNSATNNRGGGIDAGGFGAVGDATVTLTNSTVVNNSADLGSGLYQNSYSTLTLINSVAANNDGDSPSLSRDCFNSGGTLSSTASLVEDNTCSPNLSGNPQLNLTLADNGGPTQTHAVLTGSPLIDAGNQAACDAAGITTDQTGMPRSIDAEGDGAAVCDIGAFEYVDTTPPQPALNNALGDIAIGGGTSLPINVNFLDENPIDLATLGIANISATPGATITAQSVVAMTNGDRDVDVTYTLLPPGGVWDSADNGTITVAVEPNQVFDTASPVPNAAQSAQVLATFEVAVAEIDVTGNALSIASGDTTPSMDDDTDFGDVAVDVDEVRTFTITNTALGLLNLTSSITVTGGGFAVEQPAQTLLGAGESTTFTLTFNSPIVGQRDGLVSFRTNDADEDPYTFAVTANAIAPELDVTGNGVDIIDGSVSPTNEAGTEFGLIAAGTSVVRSFVLTNSGGIELTVSDISVSGEGFSVGPLAPASPIGPGETASFDLTFAPTTEGRRTGTVTIINNDANENPYTFDVAGDATAPDIDVIGNASSIVNGDSTPEANDLTDFGELAVGDETTRTFVVRNSGLGVVNLSLPITVSGAGFTIAEQPDDAALAAGESTTFSVTASPDLVGPLSGVVSIASDDPDENPFTFAVAASASTPEIDLTGNGQSIASGDATPDIADGTQFGDVSAGAAVQRTFTVSNTGSAPLNVTSIEVAGEGFSRVTSDTAFLSTGESADITVEFAPAAAGEFSASLTLISNDLDEGTYTIALAGTGLSQEIAVTGNGLDIEAGDNTPSIADGTNFGDVAVGDSLTRVFTISNEGGEPLEIASIVSSFRRFEVGNTLPATVAVGESLDLEITFRPVIEMALAARITIESNDLDEATFNFDVAARGVDTTAPVIAANGGFSVLPDAAVGTVVGQVQVSDANDDIPAMGAFAIVAGNANGAFAIGDDGTITVANPDVLGPTTLTVRVTDSAGLSDTAMITIAITGESVFRDGFESP